MQSVKNVLEESITFSAFYRSRLEASHQCKRVVKGLEITMNAAILFLYFRDLSVFDPSKDF